MSDICILGIEGAIYTYRICDQVYEMFQNETSQIAKQSHADEYDFRKIAKQSAIFPKEIFSKQYVVSDITGMSKDYYHQLPDNWKVAKIIMAADRPFGIIFQVLYGIEIIHIVGFCGIRKFGDFINGLKSRCVEFRDYQVHRGYLQMYEPCDEQIKEYLDNVVTTERVIFTGHSAGGSLATLAFLFCNKVNKYLTTFGASRVILSDNITIDNCYNFERKSDLIPKLDFGLQTINPIILPSTEYYWQFLKSHEIDNYHRDVCDWCNYKYTQITWKN